ncbi:unnamed protein product [Mytilus edulis]|uniref:Uncharacterized protein n=1 Tax=Mytilus edulis TaxID=6550 RepID=A0A8S3QWQ0_MYTED|nr:unnamed protein product [Mytilus edulis]
MRRSERYWAGLSSDLMIEQVLMRRVKTAGGLTRGRGMGDIQRSQWLLSMPACGEMNQAVQDLTGIGYHTSEQHKEESQARQKRDKDDILTVLSFIKDRNPFKGDDSLRNNENGLELESLDLQRYRKFASKVLVGNIYVQVHSLPPTSNAAKFHSLRTFYQSKIWIQDDVEIHPIYWGWYTSGNKLLPIRSTLPPAPDKLLKTIRCNCKQNCDSKRCRKHGIDCSITVVNFEV